MPLKSLEHLAARTVYEALPANWNTFDLERFSPGKRLWDYQTNALKLALATEKPAAVRGGDLTPA